VFNSQLDAQAFAVTQALGLSEHQGSFYQSTFGANVVWLKSTSGNNAANLNWYNLFPDGTLRAWNGSTTAADINKTSYVAALVTDGVSSATAWTVFALTLQA
jgi:hypothetical protein